MDVIGIGHTDVKVQILIYLKRDDACVGVCCTVIYSIRSVLYSLFICS